MNSDEDKFYIKIVATDTIYNFIMDKFFYLKLFRTPKYCCQSCNSQYNLQLCS